MPVPIYLHPFQDPDHYLGWGPKAVNSHPASLSLHWVAPTIGRARFKYISTMDPADNTFAGYTGDKDRIFVMGHCSAGSSRLTTETATGGTASRCQAWELADIFLQHGLPAGSQARICIHACDSASMGPAAAPSFAAQFKAEMQGKNYPNIRVRGFTHAVGIYFGIRWAGIAPAALYQRDI